MKRKWFETKDYGQTWEEIFPPSSSALVQSGDHLEEGEVLWSGEKCLGDTNGGGAVEE